MSQSVIMHTSRSLVRLSSGSLRILQHRSQSLPGHVRHLHRSNSGYPPETRKLLSMSTLLLQDGIDICEVPIIVRRLTDKTVLTFVNNVTPADDIKNISEDENNFKLHLQNCRTVKEVFRKLEVPADQVTGYSASFALQRISQLKHTSIAIDGGSIDSFIRTAVMNELYETVSKEVSKLTNETVVSLVQCYLNSESFSQLCTDSINTEIEVRISENSFEIHDLINLSNTMANHKKTDVTLYEHIWVHIASRYDELNEDNIASVYSSLPQKSKDLLRLLHKQFLLCWWKLKGDDVVNILSSLIKLKAEAHVLLADFGRWTVLNIHEVTEEQLMHIITAFITFNFSDSHLTRALERYVTARVSHLEQKNKPAIDINLLSLAMEYCRGRKYLSVRIFDSIIAHFTLEGHKYNALQMFMALRPIGQLNYLPLNSSSFFMMVEAVLNEKLAELTSSQAAELLCSFSYIRRHPINFMTYVYNPSFLYRIKGIKDPVEQNRAGQHLEMLQSAIKLETRQNTYNYMHHLYRLETNWDLPLDSRHVLMQKRLATLLYEQFTEDMFAVRQHAERTSYFKDFEIHCDENGKPVKLNSSSATKRLVLLVQMPEYYCINTGHLLGEHAMKKRHLKLLGYHIIEFPYHELRVALTNTTSKQAYIKKKLCHHIKFTEC